MQLTIDLSDAAEIAAAIAMLQTLKAPVPVPARQAPPAGGLDPAGDKDAGVVALATANAGVVAFNGAPLASGGWLPPLDPAAVFGAAPPPAPLAPTMPTTAGDMPVTAAPPAPASTAPATQTSGPASFPPAPPAPSAGVEVDSAGVPWNPAIHAKNKSKCQDGTWKAARGVNAASATAAPAPVAAIPAPPSSPAAQVGAEGNPTTYAQLMPRVTAAVTAGIMPPAELRVACEACGVAGIVDLQANAEHVPMVWAWLAHKYPALLTAQ